MDKTFDDLLSAVEEIDKVAADILREQVALSQESNDYRWLDDPDLLCVMDWGATEQGHKYWENIFNQLSARGYYK